MMDRKLCRRILSLCLAAVLLLGVAEGAAPTGVEAASSSEIREQINELKEKKEELQSQMEDVQNQYAATEDEITALVDKKALLDQEVFLLQEQVEVINQELMAYALLIADKQDELDAAEAKLEELSEKHRERIRAMEEEGELSYWAVLFKASSFADLLDRLNMIEEIAESDQQRLKEMSTAAEVVANAQEELEGEKEALELAKAELDAAQAELEAKQAETQALIAQMVEHADELEAIYAQYELEEQQMLEEIAQKEKEYDQAKYQEWLATYVPPTTTQAPGRDDGDGGNEGGGISDSGWLVPCNYTRVSSPFGEREAPVEGASTFHQGVDLAAPEGTPIYATRSGKVTRATSSKSAGFYVSINHGDGYASIYMHMTKFVVSAGQYVEQGQLIGYVGSTGISSGPHLHFGISYNGTYVNPMGYI